MRHTLTPLTVLLLVALSLAAPAADDGENTLDLRLRLEKGDTYTFTTQIQSTVDRWLTDGEVSETTTLALAQTVKVVAVKDTGAATLSVTYDRIALKIESDAGVFEFDSANPPDELEFPLNVLDALVGQSLMVKVSPTGKITSITNRHTVRMALTEALEGDSEEEDEDDEDGTSRRVTRVISIMAQGDNASTLANYYDGMRLLTDDKVFYEHLAFLAVLYADAPVKTSETWNKTTKETGRYAGTCETTYKLVSGGNGTAEIQLAGTIKGDPDAKPLKTGISFGPTAPMTELEGTHKGAVTIDENTGLVREGTLIRSIKGNTSTFNPMDPSNMMPVPTTVDTTIKIKGGRPATATSKETAASAD
ncbi:MAG: hypothetical protein JW889_07910 [Verrucomicrobia bacterium]|nr:hypothetical protein [Verrucomicrobiota bacterium]